VYWRRAELQRLHHRCFNDVDVVINVCIIDALSGCAGCLLMFVRERGRGGVDGAFLPDIDVFSVQVIQLMF
jgi:hypothetical protein